jgi:hypothetical protein
VFRSRGGGDYSSNLLTLCTGCHDKIHKTMTLTILAKSGDPDDQVDANIGIRAVIRRNDNGQRL